MANNPNNIQLSACRVRWGGRDLGLTKGGVDVTIKTDTKQIQVDQFGATTVNEYITGRTLSIKCPFAETDLDTLYSLTRQAGGTLNDNGTAATGTMTFSGAPIAGDTLTVNGHLFTYIAAGTVPGLNQIAAGTDAPSSIANTMAILAQSSDPNVLAALYTAAGSVINVAYYHSGTDGNAFTLATSSTKITVSGATLTGGTAATSRNVSLVTGVGISLLQTALPLVLHPINKADNDTSLDFVVPLASQAANITFAYKYDQERIFMVEFTGYPNPSTNQLCYYGSTGPIL